jgi:SAM-dependent methyltransferase
MGALVKPSIRDRLESLGWLNRGERPLIDRLSFPLREPVRVADFAMAWDDRSVRARDVILSDILEGRALATALRQWICQASDDLLIAEVDRYGLPLRTVLDRRTGLMRSDPYYDPNYLIEFYRDHYRELYRRPPPLDIGDILADQIRVGESIWQATRTHIPEHAKVLDVGCGLGGVVAAFQLHDYQAMGCDWGREYLARGRKPGLQLVEGNPNAAAEYAPFDLIVLSQVLEHKVDPVEFLQSMRALLVPDGLLYLRVPGIHIIRPLYDGDIILYLQNAHVWHFTAATLTALLSLRGFTVLECSEVVWCLARRANEASPIPVGRKNGIAVETEINRQKHKPRIRPFLRRGVRFLERRLS